MQTLAPITDRAQLIRGFIGRALAEYGHNPAIPAIMRGLATRAPDVFTQEAFTQLQSGADSPGHRQLAVLLLRHANAIALLAHPTFFSLKEAVTISKRLLTIDSLFDIRLARKLPQRDSAGEAMAQNAMERVLDIINDISRGGRIVPLLGHLTDHPNSRIAAKATLVLGRRIHNFMWIKRHLASNDFRIRANTVEALWGVDTPSAVDALHQNLTDPNNRVVGNAVIGLHILKAADTNACVNRMLRSNSPAFRWSAAWVMGKTGKPEFMEQLHHLMRDDVPGVRGAALRALFNIRKAAEPSLPPIQPSIEPAAPAIVDPVTAVEVDPEAAMEEVMNERLIDFNLHLDGSSFSAR